MASGEGTQPPGASWEGGKKEPHHFPQFFPPPQSPTAAKHCAPEPAPYQIEVSVGEDEALV